MSKVKGVSRGTTGKVTRDTFVHDHTNDFMLTSVGLCGSMRRCHVSLIFGIFNPPSGPIKKCHVSFVWMTWHLYDDMVGTSGINVDQ
jgi:hypothetical protein